MPRRRLLFLEEVIVSFSQDGAFSYEQYCVDAAVHVAVVLCVDRQYGLTCWQIFERSGVEWSGVEKLTVIWAYLPQITLPPAVTIPSSLVV